MARPAGKELGGGGAARVGGCGGGGSDAAAIAARASPPRGREREERGRGDCAVGFTGKPLLFTGIANSSLGALKLGLRVRLTVL